jgi:ATP synthase protein I
MENKNMKQGEYIRLVRLSSIGFFLVFATVIGFAMGWYLDKWLKTHGVLTIVFLLAGIAAGFINVFRTIAKDAYEHGNRDGNRPS